MWPRERFASFQSRDHILLQSLPRPESCLSDPEVTLRMTPQNIPTKEGDPITCKQTLTLDRVFQNAYSSLCRCSGPDLAIREHM